MSIITAEVKKVFKEYLKTVAIESKSKFDEIQALIYCMPDMQPVFAGSGRNGIIRTDTGKGKSFTIREIIGRTLETAYGMMGVNIKEEVSKILQQIHTDYPDIPLNEICIVATVTDRHYDDISIHLHQKTTQISSLSWEYLLNEKPESEETE